MYNITEDQGESAPLAGTPVGPDASLTLPDSPSPAVTAALAHAIGLFKSEHVENPVRPGWGIIWMLLALHSWHWGVFRVSGKLFDNFRFCKTY